MPHLEVWVHYTLTESPNVQVSEGQSIRLPVNLDHPAGLLQPDLSCQLALMLICI